MNSKSSWATNTSIWKQLQKKVKQVVAGPDSLTIWESSQTTAVTRERLQIGRSLQRFSPVALKCLTVLFMLVFLVALPAQASFCKSIAAQKVCILSIDRSAKNYWEYRVQLTIDQVIQPMAVYNCLQKSWLPPHGQWTKFTDDAVPAIACRLFRP
jgi:hypothetical protein